MARIETVILPRAAKLPNCAAIVGPKARPSKQRQCKRRGVRSWGNGPAAEWFCKAHLPPPPPPPLTPLPVEPNAFYKLGFFSAVGGDPALAAAARSAAKALGILFIYDPSTIVEWSALSEECREKVYGRLPQQPVACALLHALAAPTPPAEPMSARRRSKRKKRSVKRKKRSR